MGNYCCQDDKENEGTPVEIKAYSAAHTEDKAIKQEPTVAQPAAVTKTFSEAEVAAKKMAADIEAVAAADLEAVQKDAEAAEATKKEAQALEAARRAKEASEAAAAAEIEKAKKENVIEFTVTLTNNKGAGQWGLNLLQSEDGSQLALGPTLGSGSALTEWQKSNPDKQMVPGDEIVSINGISGTADELIAVMSKKPVLIIVFRRKLQVAVQIIKSSTLGVSFDSTTYRVTKIHAQCPLFQHNRQANPNEMVFIGDELSGVNHMTRSSHDLLKELTHFKEGDTVKLTFKRPKVEIG